MSKTE